MPRHRQHSAPTDGDAAIQWTIGHDQDQVVVLGRTLPGPDSVVTVVERTLLSVEPAANGWRINLNRLLLDLQPTRHAAIGAASEHAYRRYVVTGRPTGVALALCDGESVLVAQNG